MSKFNKIDFAFHILTLNIPKGTYTSAYDLLNKIELGDDVAKGMADVFGVVGPVDPQDIYDHDIRVNSHDTDLWGTSPKTIKKYINTDDILSIATDLSRLFFATNLIDDIIENIRSYESDDSYRFALTLLCSLDACMREDGIATVSMRDECPIVVPLISGHTPMFTPLFQ